jgi:hypothetical protein
MVDFRKLKAKQTAKDIPDPLEIFRRLPKGKELNDLYASQAEILKLWFDRREDKDLMLKLHTGGGKTLVGLLIARSTMIETELPVVYLCPNRQLAEQTITLAESYGIDAVPYVSGKDFDSEFLDSKAILVCTYAALFNGRTKFGRKGSLSIKLGAVICDDAHSAFSILREHFTISINRDRDQETYKALCGLFRSGFQDMDMIGTFEDVVSGGDNSTLEVPYWTWLKRQDEIRELLRSDTAIVEGFPWQFLRDNLKFCHALVTSRSIEVTAILPLVDLVPSFEGCPRRIYMSATLPDDGSSILAFDMSAEASQNSLTSSSLAGVSERMIILPDLTAIERKKKAEDQVPRFLISAFKDEYATCILAPSAVVAKKWEDVATYPNTPQEVGNAIEKLQAKTDKGPFVFANRYEGVDLSDDACRFLILDGLPMGTSVYESFRAVCLADSQSRNSALAQKIEQGAGRGARGQKDYCAVLLVGDSLVSWISQSKNLKLMTNATRAQIQIGQEISGEIRGQAELKQTIETCFSRDKDWRGYYAEKLAELTDVSSEAAEPSPDASIERKALRIWRDGFPEKAVAYLKKETEKTALDDSTHAWLLQFAARICFDWGNYEKAAWFQEQAYMLNRTLLRPKAIPPYIPISQPDEQVEVIFNQLKRYTFRRGLLDEFNGSMHLLTPMATAKQFERALAELAVFLGYASDRPDMRVPLLARK